MPPTSAGGTNDVTPQQSKGANTEKVKGSEVKIRPGSEASVKDTNPAQLGRCQGRKCSGGGSPLVPPAHWGSIVVSLSLLIF